MKQWLVEYSTPEWPTHKIVIHCSTREEARAAVKKHLGDKSFRITRITERNVNDENL